MHAYYNKTFFLDNKTESSSLNVQNNIKFYEIKPLSPTKLSISVKKFYNNVSTLKIIKDFT